MGIYKIISTSAGIAGSATLEVERENMLFVRSSRYAFGQPEVFTFCGMPLVLAAETANAQALSDNKVIEKGLTTIGKILAKEIMTDINAKTLARRIRPARWLRKLARNYGYVGNVLYLVELSQFAASGGDGFIPIPVVGRISGAWALLDIALSFPMQDFFNKADEIQRDVNETQRQEILSDAKLKGINKVELTIGRRDNLFRIDGHWVYHLLRISEEIASRILNGEFKSISEVRRAVDDPNHTSELNIEILYRTDILHPRSRHRMAIIETFFIDIEK